MIRWELTRPLRRALRRAVLAALLAGSACGGGGGGSGSGGNNVQPPPPPDPVIPIQTASAGYCASLPIANGGHADLAGTAASFAGTECGKYLVSCGGSDVDDMNFYAAVVPAVVAPLRGTILSFSGQAGENFHTENVQEYVDAGFRVVMVAYESSLLSGGGYGAWQCAKNACPPYVNVDDPGPKQAACRPAEIIRYFKQLYDANDQLAYCAQGHSAGSSQIAYALTHYGADAYLDYVQLTGWTPFARPDYGCDPQRYDASGVRSYSGERPDGTLQTVTDRPFGYDATAAFAHELVDQVFGLPTGECGAHPTPGVSDDSYARLGAGGIVSGGADYVYPNTVVDAFACASATSMVDGNGAWYLDEISNANPGQVFVQTLLPGAGNPAECAGEEIWWKSDQITPSPLRQLSIDRMLNSCVLLH